MALGDEADDGPHDLADPPLCVAVLLDLVQDAAPRTQLHHKMHILIVLKDILHDQMFDECFLMRPTLFSSDKLTILLAYSSI